MEKKSQDPNQMTDHHIVPSSRGDLSNQRNIKRVPRKKHEAFHTVFSNMTPAEIYDYLNEVWFNPEHSFILPEIWLWERD